MGKLILDESKLRRFTTYRTVNYACFAGGLLLVWISTHSWLGLLGAFVASLHFTSTAPYRHSATGTTP